MAVAGLSDYNINPSPWSGSGAYGTVPGSIGLPNPYADLSNVFPVQGEANKLAGSNLISQLGGRLSPETLANLQNASATYAGKSGMPGTNAVPGTLANQHNLLSNVLTSQQLEQQGLQNYNSLIPTISGTQTVNPALQTEIASRNALYNAAPNPEQANNLAQQLFDQYLQRMRGPAGGTGSATDAMGGASGGVDKWRTDAYNAFWNPPTAGQGTAGAAAANPMYADEFGYNLGSFDSAYEGMGGAIAPEFDPSAIEAF